jgi:hypothetical protein
MEGHAADLKVLIEAYSYYFYNINLYTSILGESQDLWNVTMMQNQ